MLDAPCHVAVEGDAVNASGGRPGTRWEAVDWRGRPAGAEGVFDSAGASAIPPLPAGYYRLVEVPEEPEAGGTAADSGAGARVLTTLAVVAPLPPDAAARGPESFFAADAGSAWHKAPFDCPWNGGDPQRTLADVLARVGFARSRDRISWRRAQPRPDSPLNLDPFVRFPRHLRERGLSDSAMFHDAPDWTGRTVAGGGKLPRDLGALYDFCSAAARFYGDAAEDWEFWNEEDIRFAPEPVWEYAAALKAAYLAFKSAAPDKPVLHGALCRPPGEPYAEVLFDNDAAWYLDAFNYHVYEPPAAYPGIFAALRDLLARHGAAGRAIWTTEAGTNLEGYSRTPGPRPGLMAHTPEQEMTVAEFYPKSQIAQMAAGVSRSWFFIFNAFNQWDGVKDWGTLRRDGSPKPVVAAMAAQIRAIGGARLLGALETEPGLRAFLFEQPDGSQTVAYWVESPVDTIARRGVLAPATNVPDRVFALRLPEPSADGAAAFRTTDAFGCAGEAAPDASGALSLVASRYPSYVSGLHGLVAAVPAVEPGKVAPREPAADENPAIVVRLLADSRDFALGNRKTEAELTNDVGRVTVEVWNFGDGPARGTLDVSGLALAGLPDAPFEVGPRGTGPAVFECTLSPESEDSPDRAALAVRGVFDGRKTSRACMPVFFVKRFRDSCSDRKELAWRDPARWVRNDSASSWSVSFDEAEGAVRFDAAWSDPADSRWFYPVLPLDLPGGSIAGAKCIEFEVKTEQDKVENDFRNQNLMIVRGGSLTGSADGETWLQFAAPGENWERRTIVLPPDCDTASATAIRLGANPLGTRCTMWVRGLAVLE